MPRTDSHLQFTRQNKDHEEISRHNHEEQHEERWSFISARFNVIAGTSHQLLE